MQVIRGEPFLPISGEFRPFYGMVLLLLLFLSNNSDVPHWVGLSVCVTVTISI